MNMIGNAHRHLPRTQMMHILEDLTPKMEGVSWVLGIYVYIYIYDVYLYIYIFIYLYIYSLRVLQQNAKMPWDLFKFIASSWLSFGG